jgi:2,3-bisphosphoglycerate-independent phosphoglycerate mutase
MTMVLLCIMDGFGLREATPDNAVAAAHKPTYDWLIANCPHTKIDGSGPAVGLPVGQMGNSEVGHLNLGSGRIVYQDVTRIDKAIADGDFAINPVLNASFERVAQEGKALHLMGLLSDGCVHSSMEHLYALLSLAKRQQVQEVYIHPFMDGRDTPPNAGIEYMRQLVAKCQELGLGKVATIGGRYYAMDRDKRWERTDKAWRALLLHESSAHFPDPIAAIQASYDAGVTDEFILPVTIDCGDGKCRLNERDLVVYFNFRADRARQLSTMILGHEIAGFTYQRPPHVELVTMTTYNMRMFEAKVAFGPIRLKRVLGEEIAKAGLKQLRTAETEKYPHVTFFFDGGVELKHAGEDRDMIPSPKVATYDLQPEMSSVALTENAVKKIHLGKYHMVILNYANPDMVGHTGVFSAAKAAVEATDRGVGQLLEAVKSQGGMAIITADHGNAEMMTDPTTGGPWTAHTTNLVPCILFDPTEKLGKRGKVRLRDGGILADIAPTVLEMLGLPIPAEMTGKSLIVRS